MQTIDRTIPGEKWEFDQNVTEAFDNMLQRSIPQYDVMRDTCYSLACKFIKPQTTILDLGCSRGDALVALVDKYGALNRFVGLEISRPMLAAARQRFHGLISTSVVEIREHDLRTPGLPAQGCSVILSILTIQFVPIEYRLRLLRDVYRALAPSGAFIMVEKVLGNTAEINDFQVEQYHALKAKNGYSENDIKRKQMALEGVLVPVTAQMNEQFLYAAGFTMLDCFWRWMNFVGWLAIK